MRRGGNHRRWRADGGFYRDNTRVLRLILMDFARVVKRSRFRLWRLSITHGRKRRSCCDAAHNDLVRPVSRRPTRNGDGVCFSSSHILVFVSGCYSKTADKRYNSNNRNSREKIAVLTNTNLLITSRSTVRVVVRSFRSNHTCMHVHDPPFALGFTRPEPLVRFLFSVSLV